MAAATAAGSGTSSDRWVLRTPPGKSEYEAYRDEAADPPALVVQVGSTELRYHLSCISDLHQMLKQHGDWMALGNADEQRPAADGTVEAWSRSTDNPVGGWYGLKKGLRGRSSHVGGIVVGVLVPGAGTRTPKFAALVPAADDNRLRVTMASTKSLARTHDFNQRSRQSARQLRRLIRPTLA